MINNDYQYLTLSRQWNMLGWEKSTFANHYLINVLLVYRQ